MRDFFFGKAHKCARMRTDGRLARNKAVHGGGLAEQRWDASGSAAAKTDFLFIRSCSVLCEAHVEEGSPLAGEGQLGSSWPKPERKRRFELKSRTAGI